MAVCLCLPHFRNRLGKWGVDGKPEYFYRHSVKDVASQKSTHNFGHDEEGATDMATDLLHIPKRRLPQTSLGRQLCTLPSTFPI